MAKKELLKGNEAIAESAIRAGCRYYFGYPITPQNEIPAYMSRRLPEVGGVFVQAESELASINMVYGAGAAGARVMTSSSSPGISLMQEGLSYMAGSEVPALVINIMRGGPGLGNISPSQADYLQSVKGGGHGDYHLIVLAPASVQEAADLTFASFDYAFKYRVTVMLIADGILGQMSEPVVLPEMTTPKDDKRWALGNGGEQKIIRSLYMNTEDQLEKTNWALQEKYNQIEKDISLYDEYKTSDAEFLFCAYGTPSRVCKAVIDKLRSDGLKIGLFRPISLWPFPSKELNTLSKKMKKIFVIEMAINQFEQDVRLATGNTTEIFSFNKLGGAVFDEDEVIDFVKKKV